MNASFLQLAAEVREALERQRPVVALESTIISQGLPYPKNLDCAHEIESAVRAEGAVPATVAVIAGRLRVGLTGEELTAIARNGGLRKISRRDLAPAIAAGESGATTVSATMIAAHLAGIRVFATGGIGGVHRGGEASLDVSADLMELTRTPVAVVSAGAKSILDLPRTLEVLETQGVPVIGFGTDEFPAFYCRGSGLRLECRADTPQSVAAVIEAHWSLGLKNGLLIANPIPKTAEIPADKLEVWITAALEDAAEQGIGGKQVTPFLLSRLHAASQGATVAANIALIENNARLGARIASALVADGD